MMPARERRAQKNPAVLYENAKCSKRRETSPSASPCLASVPSATAQTPRFPPQPFARAPRSIVDGTESEKHPFVVFFIVSARPITDEKCV